MTKNVNIFLMQNCFLFFFRIIGRFCNFLEKIELEEECQFCLLEYPENIHILNIFVMNSEIIKYRKTTKQIYFKKKNFFKINLEINFL